MELAAGQLLRSARIVASGDVTKTSAFSQGQGLVQIQDEGSQLVAMLAGRGERLLDCCAAPGGKTAILSERNPNSSIVAIELHEHRARPMQERLKHRANISVMRADATKLTLSADFDRALADVPCSGTGTLARNPEIKWRLSPDNLADLHRRQVAILRAALAKLRPGGRALYSTCSLEPEENEAVVAEVGATLLPIASELEMLRREGELLIVDAARLIDGPFLRVLPGEFGTDGFFAALLTR
jgi:16S rRNA (cytosine967-C5)-methyltransferase